jgi:hypothetical protein
MVAGFDDANSFYRAFRLWHVSSVVSVSQRSARSCCGRRRDTPNGRRKSSSVSVSGSSSSLTVLWVVMASLRAPDPPHFHRQRLELAVPRARFGEHRHGVLQSAGVRRQEELNQHHGVPVIAG